MRAPRQLVLHVGLAVAVVPVRVQHLLEPGLPLPQLLGAQRRAAAARLLLLVASCRRPCLAQLDGDVGGNGLRWMA